MKIVKAALNRGILGLLLILATSCRTNNDWNPFVDLGEHGTIVVNDFKSSTPKLGKELADQVASALIREGQFKTVTRSPAAHPSLVVDAAITRSRKGNLPLRIKTNGRSGHAFIQLEVRITEQPSGYEATQFRLSLDTRMSKPDARRTGRESFTWLKQEAAKQLARKLTPR